MLIPKLSLDLIKKCWVWVPIIVGVIFGLIRKSDINKIEQQNQLTEKSLNEKKKDNDWSLLSDDEHVDWMRKELQNSDHK